MLLSSQLIQAISAFMIFVIAYLALLISTVACLGIFIVCCKGARILLCHVMGLMRRAWSAPGKVALLTHQIARPTR
jgi:hypothetical protein